MGYSLLAYDILERILKKAVSGFISTLDNG
jgi:hypothetical protein